MIERIQDLPAGVVGLKATGQVTETDYKSVVEPLLDEIHSKGERVNFLYHFTPEFDGFSVGAAWQDFRLGTRHIRLFKKCGIVTGADWIRKSTVFVGAMLPFSIEVFSNAEYGQAIDWLMKPQPSHLSHKLIGDKSVLLLEPKGVLRKEDFDAVASTVDPWVEQNGKLNGLVIHAETFPGWKDIGSVVKHFQFVRDHHKKIKRVAVASDSDLLEMAPTLVKHFVDAEIKCFDHDDLDDALEWASSKDD